MASRFYNNFWGGVMSSFALDDAVEQIKNQNTKKLFKEVYSSYAMGNYRSAIVMLWSVVVTDLVYKLKELEAVYNDNTATNILNEIKKEQSKDATSSKWEIKIVSKFHSDLNFFETHEVSQLEHLQQVRHVSAHPVINNSDMLHTPTKSSVFALIENALNSVLTKEALFSSKVIDVILEDLGKIKKTLTTFEDKERYFEHKYLNKMSDNIMKKLIKTLWKFVFKLDNDDTEENRDINLDVIKIILKNNKEVFYKFCQEETKFISSLNMEGKLINVLMEFLFEYRHTLDYFEPAAKATIIALLDTPKYSRYSLIRFKKIVDYIDSLAVKGYVSVPLNSLETIKEECEDQNCLDKFYEMCIGGYSKSVNFDDGDNQFNKLIRPILYDLDINQLESLIKLSDGNSQACWRSKAERDHRLVIDRVKELYNSFDFTPYDNFIHRNEKFVNPKVEPES